VFATIIPRWQVGDEFLAGDELQRFRMVATGVVRDTFHAIWDRRAR